MTASEDDHVSQDQVEEDIKLFGDREVPQDFQLNNVKMPADINQGMSERRFPDTAFNAQFTPPVVDLKSETEAATNDHDMEDGNLQIRPQGDNSQPPLLSWLAQTEPPENPTVIQSQLQEKKMRQEHAKAQEKEDIELFRNIHVVASEREEDEPAAHTRPPISGENELEFAARIYYRNIIDRYPAIQHYLARRLAEANSYRAQRLSTAKSNHAKRESVNGHEKAKDMDTEDPQRACSSSLADMKSEEQGGIEDEPL